MTKKRSGFSFKNLLGLGLLSFTATVVFITTNDFLAISFFIFFALSLVGILYSLLKQAVNVIRPKLKFNESKNTDILIPASHCRNIIDDLPNEKTLTNALAFEFLEKELVSLCIENSSRNSTTISQDIYDSLAYLLSPDSAQSSIITSIRHSYSSEYYDENLSLYDYIQKGSIEYYYPEMNIYSLKQHPLVVDQVLLPTFVHQKGFQYAGGQTRKMKVKRHDLKTKNRITVTFNHLVIYSELLQRVICTSASNEISLLPSKLGVWEWRQTFYNKISGDVYFCDCFKTAILKEGQDIMKHDHVHIKRAIEGHSFKLGICHICKGTNSSLNFCDPMYGSPFKVKYGAYIKKFAIEGDISERDAENIVRQIKGVKKIGDRWINETLLFNYVEAVFNQYQVEREASPAWLGNQRLDIYIPELNLAIEYQGQQHFKSVDFFGGDEGLKLTQQRDEMKLSKCKDNNINLVYFSYKEDLTESHVFKILEKYIPARTLH